MSTYPTIWGIDIVPDDQLQKWSTKRLLQFYKKHRRSVLTLTEAECDGVYDDNPERERNKARVEAYLRKINLLLSSREHVPCTKAQTRKRNSRSRRH
jgi:hypothetical protein